MIGTMSARMLTVGALLGLSTLAGCTSKPPVEPLKITGIETGANVDANNRLHSPSMTFAEKSPVYASITTEGAGEATLEAKWMLTDGKVIQEQKQTIKTTGPANFAFHFIPEGGWPKGRHKVIFTIDGKEPRPREFEVR